MICSSCVNPFSLLPCPAQEKQDLLRQWVSSKENIDTVETTLRITRSQTGELEHNRELLTIAEMRSRGFSSTLKAMSIIFRICPKKCHQMNSFFPINGANHLFNRSGRRLRPSSQRAPPILTLIALMMKNQFVSGAHWVGKCLNVKPHRSLPQLRAT